MLESSIVLYDDVLIDVNVGTPTKVEFDFMRIWQWKKLLGTAFRCDDLNFYHVHPQGLTEYSNLDKNCMEGLCMAFDSLFYFHIVTFSNDDIFDLWSNITSYRVSPCSDPEFLPVQIIEVPSEDAEIDENSLQLLKLLSYGGQE